jgi:pimeloyl-ACP methyl ester carboxylesterase/DNA-binding CsgD family transcriptional regulator
LKDIADFSDRLLSLLDAAYDSAENPHAIDDLFTAADRLFFPLSAVAGPAADLVDVSPRLEGHIARLQRLIDQIEADVPNGQRMSGGAPMASLVISADNRQVVGNTVAAQFLSCTFPVQLEALRIAPVTQVALLNYLNNGPSEGSSVIIFQHLDFDKPLLAKCTRLQSRDADGAVRRGLSVVINHIDWQEGAMAYAAETFGLTHAETSLLSCLLSGLSYPDAAERLSKSRETLRAQGKSILRKAGVTQMNDLVHLMLGYAYLAEQTTQVASTPKTPRINTGAALMLRGGDGRTIQVNRYGRPGGRPLLFFHGLYQGPYLTPTLDRDLAARDYDVIAPSRPGFNKTDPPKVWGDFNLATTHDAVFVCDHFGLTQTDFLVHQAGISFACRAAAAMQGRVGAAVMISAGVPIKDYMFQSMNLESRIAGAALRYSPKLLDMLLRLGIAKWRRQGARVYLTNFLPAGSPDLITLDDPEAGPIMEKGALHMISQGSQTIVRDGMSAMSDWTDIYKHLPTRQLWLHGAHDPVMNPAFVQEFLAAQGQKPPVIYPDRGGDVLLGAAADVVARIDLFLRA